MADHNLNGLLFILLGPCLVFIAFIDAFPLFLLKIIVYL